MIKVGDVCTIQRRLSWSSTHVDHQWESVVTKLTPKRAYFNDRQWFALDDPEREVLPRYLDYKTVVVGVAQAPGKEPKGDE